MVDIYAYFRRIPGIDALGASGLGNFNVIFSILPRRVSTQFRFTG
jgi:hypothetical protein